VPANLASGGVSGISQLINHYTNWPIGLMVFDREYSVVHHRLALSGGSRFALRTALAVVVYSLFVDLMRA